MNGSIVINQAIRDELFNADMEFKPVSMADDHKLNELILNTKPYIINK